MTNIHKHLLAFIISLVIFFGLVEGAEAATYYVDYASGKDTNNGLSTSAPKKTIPTLSSGDTVIFKRGITYAARYTTITTNCTFTVQSDWGTGQAVWGGSSVTGATVVTIQHSGTTIKGLSTDYELKIDGSGVANEAIGVFPVSSAISSFAISYVEIYNAGRTASSPPEGHGIKVGDGSYSNAITGGTISYNYIHECLAYGIKHSAGNGGTQNVDTHHNLITRNSYNDPSGSTGNLQVNFSSNLGPGVINCKFHDNTVSDPYRPTVVDNMELNNSPNKVYNNIFSGGRYGIITDPYGYNKNSYGNIEIYNNIITGVGDRGINNAGVCGLSTASVLAYNNLFYGNGSAAYLINFGASCDGTQWYNNSVYQTGSVHIFWIQSGSTGHIFKNNVCDSASTPCMEDSNSCSSNTEDYNDLYRRSGSPVKTCSNGNILGIHTIIVNPLLDSPASGDLALQSGSPSIDKGYDLSSYLTTDYTGISRPKGSAWDIGAYEYVSGQPPSTYTLTVAKSGSGSGTVTGTGINCGSDCAESISSGASVTLTATPDSGSVFSGWSGGGCSGTGSCNVTMNSDITVTASFNSSGLPVALLTNGDFESGFTSGLANGWQMSADGNGVYSVSQDTGYQGSSQKIIVTTPGSWGLYIYQNPAFQLNQFYTWSFWYKAQGGDLWAQITDSPHTQVVFQKQLTDTSGIWQQATYTFQYTNSQANELRFSSYTQGTYWLDNVQLVAGADDSIPPAAPTGLVVQ